MDLDINGGYILVRNKNGAMGMAPLKYLSALAPAEPVPTVFVRKTPKETLPAFNVEIGLFFVHFFQCS